MYVTGIQVMLECVAVCSFYYFVDMNTSDPTMCAKFGTGAVSASSYIIQGI